MRNLILYQMRNGTPRRLLSVSMRLRGPGGEWHESDDAVPREFIEAAYILSEDQRPNAMVLQHKDLTPELIAEKAKKYNIIPEDYTPMSVAWNGSFGGDYPLTVEEAKWNKDWNYEWDNFDMKRNYGEVIGMRQWTHYDNCGQIYDGQWITIGYWQWYQHIFLYMRILLFWCSGIFICGWFNSASIWSSNDRYRASIMNTSFHNDRSWSKTELEWLDVFLKVEQAKDGYANRSYADHDCSNYRIGSVHFNKYGTYAGRFRHGPTGQAPIMNEQQECYMPPAGPMSFKQGHNMPHMAPALLAWNKPHPSHGKGTELADMLSTEVASD